MQFTDTYPDAVHSDTLCSLRVMF